MYPVCVFLRFCLGMSPILRNPMEHIMESKLKIIDFNHSRMFNLDDSPFSVR